MSAHLSRLCCLLVTPLLFTQCSVTPVPALDNKTPPSQAEEPVAWPPAPRYPTEAEVQSAASGVTETATVTTEVSAWQQLASDTQPFGQGVWLHDLQAIHRPTRSKSRIRFVSFDSAHAAFRVVDQPAAHAGGAILMDQMRQTGALAGVNGGFFHPNFSPLGLMIADGRTSGSFTRSSLISGSVLMVGSEPHLVWNDEFPGSSGVTQLLQAGPRLVDKGAPVASLNTTRRADRTFVATDGGRTWLVGTASSVTLAELGELLGTPGLLAGTQVERALNLDGGRSSAFYARLPGGREINLPGWSTVRNYLAVVPR